MRKTKCLVLAFCLVLSLWGCTRQEVPAEPQDEPAGQQTPAAPANQPQDTEGVAEPEQPAQQPMLEMDPTYPLTGEQIAYTVVVPEEQQAQVVLAPQLERQVQQGWQPVPCDGGFCGTPDTLEGRHEGFLLTEWYPDLSAGDYRLSFRYWSGEEDRLDREAQIISAQFQLTEH